MWICRGILVSSVLCFLCDLQCIQCSVEKSPGVRLQLEEIQSSGSPDRATAQSLSPRQPAVEPPGLGPQPQGALYPGRGPQHDAMLQGVTVLSEDGELFRVLWTFNTHSSRSKRNRYLFFCKLSPVTIFFEGCFCKTDLIETFFKHLNCS